MTPPTRLSGRMFGYWFVRSQISTPIGTGLSWSANGVSYSLVGSVPAAELEVAARGLLR